MCVCLFLSHVYLYTIYIQVFKKQTYVASIDCPVTILTSHPWAPGRDAPLLQRSATGMQRDHPKKSSGALHLPWEVS